MTTFETSQGFVDAEGYRVNVTARLDAANREHMKALVEKTMRLWLYVARHIAEGKRICSPIDCPEDMVVRNHFLPLSEARVTIWGDMPNRAGFTVHSHTKAQDALDCYWGRLDGLAGFIKEPSQTPANVSTPPPAPQNANLPPSGANSGQSPQLAAGVIPASRAPNPKNIMYADGQLVSFQVNKVAMGANKGSATYALWGPLGQQYALKTVYKCKPNSDENSPDYIAAKDFFVGLGLSVDAGKVEALGNWRLICKAAHVAQPDGSKKEYLNIVAMEAAA